ncbi:Isochorismatase hydrolase [Pisolithus tinctorius]|nr:Isochorismatase hydrolase [Pisolithus tinctorius]
MIRWPRVSSAVEYSNAASFWVVIRSSFSPCPPLCSTQLEVAVDSDRVIRVNRTATAAVVVDMQKYLCHDFRLHLQLRDHSTGPKCVAPLLKVLSALRYNWGLTDHGFRTGREGGFGSELRGRSAGGDLWIHKNGMSGLWGRRSVLDLYFRNSITTPLTMCLGHYGYCMLVKDITTTTSPSGGLENVIHNTGNARRL